MDNPWKSERGDSARFLRISLRTALAVGLAGVILITLLVILAGGGHWHGSALETDVSFFQLRQGQDSWGPMAQAYAYLRSAHQETVYHQIFFDQKTKFQYPLSSLLVFVPLGGHWKTITLLLSWLFLMCGLGAVVGIYLSARGRRSSDTPGILRQEILLLAALGLTFYPWMYAFQLGQIQVWINALVSAAFWCWMRGQPRVSGILIGIACLIKPQYLVILLWGLLRHKGRFCLSVAATYCLGLLASVLLFGARENWDYLSVVRFIGARGEAFYANQSFNGLLNRMLFNGDNLLWQPHLFPPLNSWVNLGTLVTSLALIGLALFWPRRADERGGVVDLMTVILSATMASPVAWEHHYGILLPLFAYLLPRLQRDPIWGRLTLPALGLSYWLAADFLVVTNRLAATALNVFQSYLLLGALLVLALLYGIQRSRPHDAAGSEPMAAPRIPQPWQANALFCALVLGISSFLSLPSCGQTVGGQMASPPDFSSVPGVVITHSPAATRRFIGSPGLAVLPNGTYLAKCDLFGPGINDEQIGTTRLFVSADKGRTWTHLADVLGMYWASLFPFRGAVYLLGVSHEYGQMVIARSEDGGRIWTKPTDSDTGLLSAAGNYHCAPGPVLEYRGRLWRAFEERDPASGWAEHFRAFLLSATVDSDLLHRESWRSSAPLAQDPSWNGGDFGGWLEGNAVAAPNGEVVDILRVAEKAPDEKAAILHLSRDGQTATFDPKQDLVEFPGGGSKFTIRFDPRAKLYWSLANYVPPRYRAANPGAIRNTLALISSPDLRVWTVRSILLSHPDPAKYGFQYVDWQFDGQYLIFVSRTAYDDGLGGADNYHNANFLTFHRVPGFRLRTMETPPLDATLPNRGAE